MSGALKFSNFRMHRRSAAMFVLSEDETLISRAPPMGLSSSLEAHGK